MPCTTRMTLQVCPKVANKMYESGPFPSNLTMDDIVFISQPLLRVLVMGNRGKVWREPNLHSH